ncbi:phosphate ABC transporter permease [Methyloprofundus sedimenti]|uniref:Transport permease protein n=1 Tax=Methyloprofundus sedimenti TaxID=1420851 RepID=A0A1V8M2Q4_9GAMM|nr:ABC transporter permease [Methyloprofundus sedimenti]OQK15835.1 phosphate ABC transporter permease [Methyloprofundus sedimenti]
MANQEHFQFTIEAGKTERHYWKDIWRYRELFYILAWRDIAVRYKQTIIGVLWAVIRPLLTMIIFVVVFGKIAKLPSEGVPYPIFVFAAMLPWTFFATAFADASISLIGNANLISKVYFPRLIIPAASVIVAAVDFMISFSILVALMVWYSYWPDWQIVSLPLFLLLGFFAALGTGLFVASLNVKYRDFRFVIPFIVQLGLYISPVGFSSTIVPEQYRLFYYLNPMVGIIDGFRWVISGGKTALNTTEIGISIGIVIILCLVGVIHFRKTEKTFADVI